MITIFTDGSSRGNPGPGGWGAIIIKEDSVMEIGGREDHTTNNRMELSAVISALQSISHESEIQIFLDSAYVLNGSTRWVKGWERNDWKTSTKEDVVNKDLWEEMIDAMAHKTIDWKLIKGHAGNPGNERCDEIATSFADNDPRKLYSGPRSEYKIDISTSVQTSNVANKSKSKSKAYSYVSMVDDTIKVHKTWDECKARVNGVSGARFKKSTSPADEEEIIKEFTQ